jgi:hypothetical protein
MSLTLRKMPSPRNTNLSNAFLVYQQPASRDRRGLARDELDRRNLAPAPNGMQ